MRNMRKEANDYHEFRMAIIDNEANKLHQKVPTGSDKKEVDWEKRLYFLIDVKNAKNKKKDEKRGKNIVLTS